MKILHPFAKAGSSEIEIKNLSEYNIHTNDGIYLDAISGIYNCPLGYNVPEIQGAIYDALHNIPTGHIFSVVPGISQTNIYLTELEKTLSRLVPFSKNLFLTNSGSEAIDSALVLCKLHSKSSRHKIVSYRESYHGSTRTTLSASGNISSANEQFLFVDFYSFYDTRTVEEYLEYIENRLLDFGPSNILAFIAEPFIGASGGFFMKENILPGLRKILSKYGIYLILDEVISGFGRLGTMFAWEKYQVIPDVLVVSKAITNGYMPLACCMTNFEFDKEEAISLGYSTAGHPLACAAALASITLIEKLVEDNILLARSKYFQDELSNQLKDKCYKIDGEGLFAAIHFSQHKDRYERYPVEMNKGGTLATRIRERGIIVRGNPKSLIIAPGYTMLSYYRDDIIRIISEEINEI